MGSRASQRRACRTARRLRSVPHRLQRNRTVATARWRRNARCRRATGWAELSRHRRLHRRRAAGRTARTSASGRAHMPRIDCVVESAISRSARARQLEAMFDVPAAEKCRLAWNGDVPFDVKPWHVGLIVGPSGCGKSTIARHLFDVPAAFDWRGKSVIDDFDKRFSIEDIARVCQAVGFNTIPAWLRPYGVLSTGERFRVSIARALLELPDPIVIDEFTSVVDRQVAQIGAHAVQKYVRSNQRQFVAVSCHYDIVDWLQPDWIFEPATMQYTAREGLQRRPSLDVSI